MHIKVIEVPGQIYELELNDEATAKDAIRESGFIVLQEHNVMRNGHHAWPDDKLKEDDRIAVVRASTYHPPNKQIDEKWI